MDDDGRGSHDVRATSGEPVVRAGLHLPATGPGSLARPGRRLVAVFIDWISCLLIVRLVLPGLAYPSPDFSAATLVLFAGELLLLTWLAGGSFGHRLLGMRVVELSGGRPGLTRVAVRTLLLMLVVPAVVWDRDGRGLHDRLAGTILVRR